ncbi:hypothetical protein BJX62DRAFT_150914 [Aspergillus germanicus]
MGFVLHILGIIKAAFVMNPFYSLLISESIKWRDRGIHCCILLVLQCPSSAFSLPHST